MMNGENDERRAGDEYGWFSGFVFNADIAAQANPMTKSTPPVLYLLATVVVGCIAANARAATISVEVDDNLPQGQTGRLSVLVDTRPEEISFRNGQISLAIESFQPGGIRFTEASIVNRSIFPAGQRWTLARVTGLSDNSIDDLYAVSVGAFALAPFNACMSRDDCSDGRFLFATIDYEVIGPLGDDGIRVGVGPSQRPNPLVSMGTNVSALVTFVPPIPEPTTAALSVLALGAAAARRRNILRNF